MKAQLPSKAELREQMRALLLGHAEQWFESANQLLMDKLNSLLSVNIKQPAALLSFIPNFHGEPDLIKSFNSALEPKGITLFCPRCSKSGELNFYRMPALLEKGNFGILEPKDDKARLLNTKDFESIVCLVPGMAFDRSGVRLGRGKGIYDKFLQNIIMQSNILKIGVGWSFQVIEAIPSEEHDQKMDVIITETNVIEPSPIDRSI